MIKSLFQICLILCFYQVSAQNLRVENINDEEFPTISGELVVRNPEGINVSKVAFLEGNTLLEATFETGQLSKQESTGKCVVLLVLNHQAHRKRTQWYQEVIRSAIDEGLIQEGDEFAIQSFDCNRPEFNDLENQLLFPKNPVFVSSKSGLKQQVNDIDLRKERFTKNCINLGNIYGAINKCLKTLDKHETDLPKSIVVFAADWSLPIQAGTAVVSSSALDFDIPVYGITYYQNIQRQYGIQEICENSFGGYFIDKSNSTEIARDALLEFGENMFQRAQGVRYRFRFETTARKDGKNHAVKVTYKKGVTGFSYNVPSLTFWGRLKESPLITGSVVGFLLLLIVVVILLRRKQKRQRAEQERRQAEEMKRIEKEQQVVSNKSSRQEQEIKRLKAQEQRKKVEEKKAKELAKQEADERATLELMSARGNLPWITYNFDGLHGSVEVDASEFVVGRNDDNNFQINHAIVSRKHFKISFEHGGYKITDLNSSNGTLLNGSPVLVDVLNHGDVISIGDIHLTFHI